MTSLLDPVKTRSRASRDTPGHAPLNIKELLGAPSDRYYTISVESLRAIINCLARPPPQTLPQPPPPAALKPRSASKPPPQPLWLRPRDAVALYGIRMTLLYRLINEGRVISKLIGGARVISVASLDVLGDTDPKTRRRGRPRRGDDAAE